MGALDILTALGGQGGQSQDQYATPEQIKQLRDFGASMQKPISGPMYSPWQGVGDLTRAIMGGLANRSAAQYENNNYMGGARAMPNFLAPQSGATQPMPQPQAPPQPQGATSPQVAPDFGHTQQAGGPGVGGPSMPPVQATPQQLDKLTRTIMTEAGNEPIPGQIAVASVARNRLFAPGYGKSLDDILTPSQFNGLGTDRARTISPQEPAYQQAYQIAQGVMSGAIPDTSHGATNFYAPVLQAQQRRPAPDWATQFPKTTEIGGHVFYQNPQSAPYLQGAQKPSPQGVGGPQPQAGGPPQAQPMMAPMQAGIQALPNIQQIQELSRNPLTHAYAQELEGTIQKQTAPQGGTTPAGQNFIGNPYTGYSSTPIPGAPHIENLDQQFGNVKYPNPNVNVYDKNGNFIGLHPVPSVDAQGNPMPVPQGQNRGSDIGEPPINGTAGQKANYATQLEGQTQAYRTQGEHNAAIQQGYNEQGRNAITVLRNTSEMRNLAHGINPNNASEIKEQVGNVLQSLGFQGDDVAKLLGTDPGDVQAFRKATAALATGITKSNFPRSTQSEFQTMFNNASPNTLMTPQGLNRVIQMAEKGADLDLQEQDAFTKYKNSHPASDWGDFPNEWHQGLKKRIQAGEFNTAPGTLGGPQAERGGPLPSPAEGPQNAAPAFKEGDTASGPGGRIVFKGGRWVPLQ